MLSFRNTFLKYLGESGVAACFIACYLFPVVFSIANAVAQSAQPIISYNYGAGQPWRVRATLRIALVTALICVVTVTLGLGIGTKAIVAAFLNPDETA